MYQLTLFLYKDKTLFFIFYFVLIGISICVLDFSSLVLMAAICSAVEEDANRAIELKNGSSVGGRKIAVKHAMPRPPREERQSKPNQG